MFRDNCIRGSICRTLKVRDKPVRWPCSGFANLASCFHGKERLYLCVFPFSIHQVGISLKNPVQSQIVEKTPKVLLCTTLSPKSPSQSFLKGEARGQDQTLLIAFHFYSFFTLKVSFLLCATQDYIHFMIHFKIPIYSYQFCQFSELHLRHIKYSISPVD